MTADLGHFSRPTTPDERAHIQKAIDGTPDVGRVAFTPYSNGQETVVPPDAPDGGGENAARIASFMDEADPDRIPIYTGDQVLQMTTADPEWVIRGFFAKQAITELDGKIKRGGKSTFMSYACRSIVTGQSFMGYPTEQARVLYVTEQQVGPYVQTMEPSGLLSLDGVHTVFRADIAGRPWPEMVDQLSERALGAGVGLLVVDTLGKLARLENENDNSEWMRAMEPLQDAAHRGLAVAVVRHERKGGGEVGESGRGGSAASGDVDIIFQIRRPTSGPANRRVIESLGRYRETPEELVIELDEDENEFRVLGDTEAVAVSDCVRHLRNQRGQKPFGELLEGSGHGRTTMQRSVDQAISEGWLRREGAGKRGDPFIYEVRETELVSAQPSPTVGVQQQKPSAIEDDYPASAWEAS